MVGQQTNKTEHPAVHIKQRIIGAIVLVSLGVIFIPMLLNSERSLDDGMPVFGSNIPEKPQYITEKEPIAPISTSNAIIIKSQADFDSRIIDEQTLKTKKKIVASFAKVDSKNKVTSSKKNTAKSSPNKKIITAKKIPSAKKPAKAWAIQVGSFSERKNAFSLRNKLRSKKFTAFVETVDTKKGPVFRVRVGPEIKRTEAEKIQKKLLADLKIKGLVIAHP